MIPEYRIFSLGSTNHLSERASAHRVCASPTKSVRRPTGDFSEIDVPSEKANKIAWKSRMNFILWSSRTK
jgi:hypothetical protein